MAGSDVITNVSETPTLTCNVSAIPSKFETTVRYQWKRPNMTEITEATSAMYQFSSPVSVSDAGMYVCEVTVSDKGGNSYVIPGIGLVEIALNVTSK